MKTQQIWKITTSGSDYPIANAVGKEVDIEKFCRAIEEEIGIEQSTLHIEETNCIIVDDNTIRDLHHDIGERNEKIKKLEQKQEEISKEISCIESEISNLPISNLIDGILSSDIDIDEYFDKLIEKRNKEGQKW